MLLGKKSRPPGRVLEQMGPIRDINMGLGDGYMEMNQHR